MKAILEKYRTDTCSPEEKQLVEQWYVQLVETGEWQWESEEKEQLEKKLEARLLQQIDDADSGNRKIYPIYQRRIIRWWAAASVILLVGIGFFLFNKTGKPTTVAKTSVPVDVNPPRENKAIITLADGKTITLDSMASGMLARQGNIKLVKLADGQIAYETATGDRLKDIRYNTLYNPKGSKVIDMALSDGTHVWLNAGSTVTYPVVFMGDERKVSVNGEAYFEVAHDATRPFIVSKGETSVLVLGTHFNVNAYDDERDIRVTLLEGAVKISNKTSNGLLKPGEQARVATKTINISKEVNLDAVMAWKNGRFNFDNADLSTVLRQLARWYDLEIVYEGNIPEREFGGQMQRNLLLSQILEILQKMGVKFRIEGKKLLVTAAQ